ncbi:MAG: ABC transporter ATP-binding protein [Chthonomonas sp.]|nr:ABC transporter ATP-binding protein [Chthonomonas sp.]
MPVASIHNLTVQYGRFVALNQFSVEVPEGCVGLLGPNGAGKSTLIKTLLGLVKPAGGTASVLGLDIATHPADIRSVVGYMPEQDCHIPGMSGVGFVAYAGELSGLSPSEALRRAHEVLEYSGLGEARYRLVETYSTGMKQRVKLAQALVHGPKLLLLDEPTNGLDPKGRDEMLDLIIDITRTKGMNVIVSSHLLPDIERTCEKIVVVLRGELRSQGAISDLTSLEGWPVDVELRESNTAFLDLVRQRSGQVIQSDAHSTRIVAPGTPEEVTRFLLQCAAETGSQIRSVRLAHRSLEEVFLEVLR